jgi:uncharacterized membrane protein YdjX (TVP38/TMEM64 family)
VTKPPSTPAPAADADPDARRAWLRLGALALGILAALLIVATVSGFSAQRVRDWVDGFGVAAPLVFIVLSAALTCALFPGPVLAAASGLLFGTALGFPVSLASATLGACCAFAISRRVGFGAVEQLAGPRLRRIRDWIGRRGFVAVLYARIVPGMPFTLVNYAAGLTPLPLPVFAAATVVGAAPRAFAYTALGGSFGNWRSPETFAAAIVLAVMAIVGLALLRREVRPPGSGTCSSSPASPTADPP